MYSIKALSSRSVNFLDKGILHSSTIKKTSSARSPIVTTLAVSILIFNLVKTCPILKSKPGRSFVTISKMVRLFYQL